MEENNKLKTIGILGGMGPMATVECFKSIVEKTPVDKDQNHLPIFIYNIPQVPDRTEAILYNGDDPLPILKSSAKKLENAGADFIIIPCNTAHYFIDDIQKTIGIPIINMVKSTIDHIPEGSNVGLLATSGTIKTGIYQKYAEGKIDIFTPDEEYQEIFMDVIYGKKGVKAGYYGEKLTKNMLKVSNHLKEKGANYIIAGCTEVRLVLENSDLKKMTLIRPIDVISNSAVQLAMKDSKII